MLLKLIKLSYNLSKNQQRTLDSLQASLEAEARGRAELMRTKKQLESNINDLESALAGANRTNVEVQKAIRVSQEQIKDFQQRIDGEQRSRDAMKEQYNLAEKRSYMLQNEREQAVLQAESAERAKRQAEDDLRELREQVLITIVGIRLFESRY